MQHDPACRMMLLCCELIAWEVDQPIAGIPLLVTMLVQPFHGLSVLTA